MLPSALDWKTDLPRDYNNVVTATPVSVTPIDDAMPVDATP